MENQRSYRLTGGVFFLLMSRGLKKIKKTEVDCLSALAAVFDGGKKYVTRKTMRSNTTQYKKCELENSLFLPFCNENLQGEFRHRLEHAYSSVLFQMSVFTKEYIPKEDYSWLASAIDELLRCDESAKQAQFHILRDGSAVSYQELLDLDNVEIEPFLTGIWGFILTERPHNTDGAGTIREMTMEADTKGNPHPFVSDIGRRLLKTAVSMKTDTHEIVHRSILLSGAATASEAISIGEIHLTDDTAPDNDQSDSKYDGYCNRIKKDYDRITTLLYADVPQPFYDFYVCNDMYRMEAGRGKRRITIKNATVSALLEHSNYVLLSGNGGLGKSMMMRHFLLDCVNRYAEVGLLPIFLELRTFAETGEALPDYAYRVFQSHGGEISRNDFSALMKAGDILLLCDGLDEVRSEERQRFQLELEEYVSAFPKSAIVISSRPFGPFSSHAALKRFTVFYLEAFSEPQAIELVNKLRFHEDKPEIKQRFLAALKEKLYQSHYSFAQNPLLLTIMMMMYADIGDVPSEMHRFYNEAFLVLARKHDATKGVYKRPLATGLEVEDYNNLFTEFCARTYYDEMVELTDEQMEGYFKRLKDAPHNKPGWNYESFTEDLTSNLCLLYYESLKYHFIHRSFQEYFCARYLSDRLDRNLYKLSLTFFESKRIRSYTDSTFQLLYDMNPVRIEDNVFLPFLTDLFDKCAKDPGSEYIAFLRIMYPVITYNHGTVSSEIETEATSFLYKFITETKFLNCMVSDDDFPYEPDFVEETYVELDETWARWNDSVDDAIVRKSDVGYSYRDEFGEPEVVGYDLAFGINTVLAQPTRYKAFLDRLLDDGFALKKEYTSVREYYEQLRERHNEQPDDDVFDLL